MADRGCQMDEDLLKMAEELLKEYGVLDFWWVVPALVGAIVWIWKKSAAYGDLDLVSELKQGSVKPKQDDVINWRLIPLMIAAIIAIIVLTKYLRG